MWRDLIYIYFDAGNDETQNCEGGKRQGGFLLIVNQDYSPRVCVAYPNRAWLAVDRDDVVDESPSYFAAVVAAGSVQVQKSRRHLPNFLAYFFFSLFSSFLSWILLQPTRKYLNTIIKKKKKRLEHSKQEKKKCFYEFFYADVGKRYLTFYSTAPGEIEYKKKGSFLLYLLGPLWPRLYWTSGYYTKKKKLSKAGEKKFRKL